MEAQQRSGTAAPQPPRIAYACPDCHKTVTSARNLQVSRWCISPALPVPFSHVFQRHRQTCTVRGGGGGGGGNNNVMGMPSSSVTSSSGAMCPASTSVMISPTSSYSNLSYTNYNLVGCTTVLCSSAFSMQWPILVTIIFYRILMINTTQTGLEVIVTLHRNPCLVSTSAAWMSLPISWEHWIRIGKDWQIQAIDRIAHFLQ